MANLEEIKKLRTQAHAQIKKNDQQQQGKQPQPFQDSTWLYIRSYETDTGTRSPTIVDADGSIFWLSPDIELFNRAGDNVDRLVEKEDYRVEVTIRNAGDLNAYACTVELYLCDPALGFSLTAPSTVFLGLQSTEVMSGSSTTVEFPFVAEQPNVGHKCMFARVHSVINREIPAVVSTLDPFHNRHDAQQNLVITTAGEVVMTSMAITQPGTMTLFVRATDQLPKTLLASPLLKGVQLIPLRAATAFQSRFTVFPVMDEKGLKFGPNAPLSKMTKAQAKELGFKLENLPNQPLLVRGQSGWTFAMQGAGVQRFHLAIPQMGLQPGQAAAFQVFSTNKNKLVTGGITFIVKG